jgi:ubiquinone/menaquinone biosynthesis C-methylase UbiE
MPQTAARNEYDRLAAIYDWWWHGYLTRTLTFLQCWAHIAPEARVLNVACGTGAYEELVLGKQPTQRMVGIDISKEMLAVAVGKVRAYPHVSLQVASARQLPFADGSFDVVVTASALHYFDEPRTALAEMRRALVPGGKLVLLDWCRDFATVQLIDHMLKIVEPAHKQAYTQAELHRLLRDADFQIQAATKRRFGLVWGLMATTATKQGAGVKQ